MPEHTVDLHEPASLFHGFRLLHCPPYREIPPDLLPVAPYRLLVHRGHMTAALEEFYAGSVRIQPLERVRQGSWYSRAVLLYVDSYPGPVQFGIMALDLAAVPDHVVERVLRAEEPLGRILMDVHPLRTVTPVAYWCFEPTEQWERWFGDSGRAPFFGRTAVIECDQGPTVLLLEVVPMQPATRPGP